MRNFCGIDFKGTAELVKSKMLSYFYIYSQSYQKLKMVHLKQEGIEDFRHGRDIYLALVKEIYNRPLTKADKEERQLGKVGVLGCGFQMGAARFKEHVKNQAGLIISDELARKTVDTYRKTYPEVVRLWYAQERAAINAVRNGGKRVEEALKMRLL